MRKNLTGYPAGPRHNPSLSDVLPETFLKVLSWQAWFSRPDWVRPQRPFFYLNLQEYNEYGYIN